MMRHATGIPGPRMLTLSIHVTYCRAEVSLGLCPKQCEEHANFMPARDPCPRSMFTYDTGVIAAVRYTPVFRRQSTRWREARRRCHRVADEVRTGDQSEGCEGARQGDRRRYRGADPELPARWFPRSLLARRPDPPGPSVSLQLPL